MAQDTVILKNGKVVPGKIISISYGIELLIAKDTVRYTADEVASLMLSSPDKNCPCSDTNSNGDSSAITNRNAKKDPCNEINKNNKSTDILKPKTGRNTNQMH